MIIEDSGYKYILVSAGRKPTDGYYISVDSLVGFEKLIVLDLCCILRAKPTWWSL